MDWGLCTPFSLLTSSAHGVIFSRDQSDIVKGYIFYVHRLYYSFSASDGSVGVTTGRVISPHSIMLHHGFRSEEVRHAINK